MIRFLRDLPRFVGWVFTVALSALAFAVGWDAWRGRQRRKAAARALDAVWQREAEARKVRDAEVATARQRLDAAVKVAADERQRDEQRRPVDVFNEIAGRKP